MRLALAWMVIATSSTAFAEIVEEPAPPEPDQKGAEPKLLPQPNDPSTGPKLRLALDHKKQFQISLRLATGIRAITTYGGDDYCGDTDKDTSSGNAPVCTSRVPFLLGVELAYGVHKKIDVLFELDLGLESDFSPTSVSSKDGPHPVKMSLGARRFFSEGEHSKLFATGQLVADLSGYDDAAGSNRGNDFGLRNLNGFWYDIAREYGAYVYFGETATFARWFDFEVEFGIGIQGRYP